jgi:integrase
MLASLISGRDFVWQDASRIRRETRQEQVRVLLDAVNGDRLEALYVLAVTIGLRQGELLGLKWDDIDLEIETLQVRRTLTTAKGGPVLSAPKTKGRRRTVRLSQTASEALRSHLRSTASTNPSA